MKKSVDFTFCGKSAKMEFTIARMAGFERAIGTSLISYMLNGKDFLDKSTIDVAIAGLAYGLEGEHTLAEATELLQEHCDNGGTIFDVANAIRDAILASGIVTNSNNANDSKKKEA